MPDLPPPGPSFPGFLNDCLQELTERNAEHRRRWGFGDETTWQLDQDRRRLRFRFSAGRDVEVEPQIIGSLDRSGRWLWAWANDSIDQELRRDAVALRAWGDRWGLDPLTLRSFDGDDQDAWTMTALALHLLRADGAYRAVVDDLKIFMVFWLDKGR